MKRRSDLDDAHRIADEVRLSPERLSGSATAMNLLLVGFSTTDDGQSPRLTFEFQLLMTSALGFTEWQLERLRSEVEAGSNRAAVFDRVDSHRSGQEYRGEQTHRLRSAVSAEHQGNFQSDEDLSERIAKTVNLLALDHLFDEERDESKKSKGWISDRENNGADAGDGLQQKVLSPAEDVAQQGETVASIPEDVALLHQR
jgi:hypothetical protein